LLTGVASTILRAEQSLESNATGLALQQ